MKRLNSEEVLELVQGELILATELPEKQIDAIILKARKKIAFFESIRFKQSFAQRHSTDLWLLALLSIVLLSAKILIESFLLKGH